MSGMVERESISQLLGDTEVVFMTIEDKSKNVGNRYVTKQPELATGTIWKNENIHSSKLVA